MLNKIGRSSAKAYTLNTSCDIIVETTHTEEGIDCFSVFYHEPASIGGLYTTIKDVLFPSGEIRNVIMQGDWWNSNSTVLSHFTGKKYKGEQLKLFGNLGYFVLVEDASTKDASTKDASTKDNGAQHD